MDLRAEVTLAGSREHSTESSGIVKSGEFLYLAGFMNVQWCGRDYYYYYYHYY
jgi:hypothetical protein